MSDKNVIDDKYINQIKSELKEEFLELVAIDSPSWGEAEMAKIVKRKLEELGLRVTEDSVHNLYGYLPGELDREPILFSAHMDTVEPSKGKKAVCEPDGTIRSAGNAVLGADCLSGLVEILQGIRLLKAAGRPHRPEIGRAHV